MMTWELKENARNIILSRVCGDYIRQGIGLTTGFIGSHTVTHNYSVYNSTAHYSLLQHLPSLLTVSSLAACFPIPDSARTPRLTDARPEYSLFRILKTRSLQLTRLDSRFTVDSRLGNSARSPRLTDWRSARILFCILKTRSLQLTRLD
jgi:hypothetical protein